MINSVPEDKQKQSKDINDQINEFFAKGGKKKELPFGVQRNADHSMPKSRSSTKGRGIVYSEMSYAKKGSDERVA